MAPSLGNEVGGKKKERERETEGIYGKASTSKPGRNWEVKKATFFLLLSTPPPCAIV